MLYNLPHKIPYNLLYNLPFSLLCNLPPRRALDRETYTSAGQSRGPVRADYFSTRPPKGNEDISEEPQANDRKEEAGGERKKRHGWESSSRTGGRERGAAKSESGRSDNSKREESSKAQEPKR